MPEIIVNTEIAIKLGISPTEFEKICSSLSRLPNFAELCLFSAIRTNKIKSTGFKEILNAIFPDIKNNFETLTNGGSIVKISDQLSCFMKIESVDLPFKSGPYPESTYCLASAARAVIESGASPVAVLNTFRFGMPELGSTKKIAEEFLKGIGEIGNSLGYPIVGAKINFEKCFNDNPELNTLVVGLIDNKSALPAQEETAQYKVFMVSDEFNDNFFVNKEIKSIEDIQTILTKAAIVTTSGFSEKKLHEATLEAIQTGAISMVKAIGKNGLLYSLSELSINANKGFIIDFDKLIPSKDIDKALGILFSGQFAKIILLIEDGKEGIINEIYNKWELNFIEIGKTDNKQSIVFKSGAKVAAELPIDQIDKLNIVPQQKQKNKHLNKKNNPGLALIPLPEDLKEVAWFLIKNPNIASKKWINEQYDSMAGISNMSTNFVSDAVLINIKGTDQALALCMTGNQKHIKASPFVGTQIAIAAACRKIACSGAKPLAVLPSIGFLNLDKPIEQEILKAFASALNQACNQFKLPIVNGNIKVNTSGDDLQVSNSECPTLTIGMLGLLEDKNNQMTISFKNKGNIIFLIGPSKEDIAASEYLVSYHKKEPEKPPFFDLELEYKVQSTVIDLIKKKYICSAHNVSRGGLFISLVESAMISGFGFDIISDTDIRLDAFLFGESQGRVLVSINPNKETYFIDFMMKKEIPFLALGHVTKGEMRIDDISYGFIEDARRVYENVLESIMEK